MVKLNRYTTSQNYLIQNQISTTQDINLDVNSNQYYVYPIVLQPGYVGLTSTDNFQDYSISSYWSEELGGNSEHLPIHVTNKSGVKYELTNSEIYYVTLSNVRLRQILSARFPIYYLHIFNKSSDDVNVRLQIDF